MILAKEGGSFQRTKHLLCKDFYVRERIENKEIYLQYIRTEDMLADMMTKPLQPQTHERLLRLMRIEGKRGNDEKNQ